MKGSKGSNWDIKIFGDFAAVAGLDRFLRVYNFKTKESIQNVYLKQKQMCILVDGTREVDLGKAEDLKT